MFFQRFRCGLAGSGSLDLAASHAWVFFVKLCWRRWWPASSSSGGEAPVGLEKNLEEELFCKEVLVLVCNFLFFPGCG